MKSYHYPIILITFLSVILYSCSIEEEFHFNSDFSGHYTFRFDYSELKEFDTSGVAGDEMSKGYDEMETELLKIDGISNIVINTDNSKGTVEVAYDFSSIDAINQANYNNETQSYTKFFTLSGKKLSFKADFSEELEEYKEPSMDDEELLKNIESFVDYTITIRFDKNIKVLDLQNFSKIDDHTLSLKLNEASLEKASSFNVKVK